MLCSQARGSRQTGGAAPAGAIAFRTAGPMLTQVLHGACPNAALCPLAVGSSGRGHEMIVGIGVDVVEVSRFRRQLQRTPALRQRLFTPAERELNTRSLAARFAAKEAIAKALGAPSGMNWQDCTICVDAGGDPYPEFTGTVAAASAAKGVKFWHLSMSHDGDLATAMVVAER